VARWGWRSALPRGSDAAVDLDRTLIGEDFIDDVRNQLSPNWLRSWPEIEEDWNAGDTAMESSGTVPRLFGGRHNQSGRGAARRPTSRSGGCQVAWIAKDR
jgi:hypothetical protein